MESGAAVRRGLRIARPQRPSLRGGLFLFSRPFEGRRKSIRQGATAHLSQTRRCASAAASPAACLLHLTSPVRPGIHRSDEAALYSPSAVNVLWLRPVVQEGGDGRDDADQDGDACPEPALPHSGVGAVAGEGEKNEGRGRPIASMSQVPSQSAVKRIGST